MKIKNYLVAFVALLLAFNLSAQNYQSYILDNTIPYKWESFEPVVPTEVVALVGEDEVYALPLPFNFRYFDSTYTSLFVGINGYVSFGQNYNQSDFNREHLCNPVAQLYNPAGEQDALNPDNFIAAFWDDLFLDGTCTPLDGGTPKLAYRTIGTAPNREFIIVWDYFVLSGDLVPCATVAPDFASQLNVELRLFEGTNVIEVHVKNNQLTTQEATIAVENIDGTYAEYAHCSGSNPPGPGPQGFRFTPSTTPPTGGGGPLGYCAGSGEDCATALRWISNVTLSNMANRSTCSNGGYTDYTSTVTPAKVDTGRTYLLTVNTLTFTNAGYITRAWIDWNRDTIFDELTELYQMAGTSSGAATGEGIYTATINVPNGITPGRVRMRVRHTFAANNINACGPETLGEVEDYDIEVGVPATGYCPASGGACPGIDAADANFDHITAADIQTDLTNVVNVSGCNNGYGDFTGNNNLWVNWSGGNNYTVVLKRKVPGYVFAKSAVYVDWNQDLDFDDANESFQGVPNIVDSTTTFVIVAPANPTLGFTRMRLRTTIGQATTASPCGVQTSGEVEDYTVIITDPSLNLPGCVATTVPTDGAMDLCQAQVLKWNTVADADGYTLNLWEESPTVVLVQDADLTDTTFVINSLLNTGKTYAWTIVPYNADGDAFNCDTLRFTISADMDPTTSIIPNLDTVFQCMSTPIVLDGNPMNGTQPYSHSWNGSDNTLLSDTAVANPTFAGAANGNYAYKYTLLDSKGCKAVDSIVVSIIPAVFGGTIQATLSDLCAGKSTTLNHSGFAGNITFQDSIAGGAWNDVTLNNLGGNEYETGILNVTTYYRAIANGGTCADTSALEAIIVNPIPANPLITANGPTTFCFGDSVTLTVSNYITGLLWTDPLATTTPSLVVKNTGSYAVKYTDANGCSSNSSFVAITVNVSPNKPQIQVVGNQNACAGETLLLFVNNPNNDMLVWNDALATQNDSLYVSTAGTYHVTASKNGCSTVSDDVTFLFNFKPTDPTIRRIGAQFPCVGDSVVLISSYATGIQWSNNQVNDTIVVYADGTFNVTYTDNGGCSSTSGDVTITFAPTPAKPTVIQVGDSLMCSVSGATYQWVGPLGPINGANKQYFKPVNGGNYRVVVYTIGGCASPQSDPYRFSGTGLQEWTLQGVDIYPNPTVGLITIELPVAADMEVVLTNTLGVVLKSTTAVGNKTTIDVNQMAAGTYLLQVRSGGKMLVKPIVKY